MQKITINKFTGMASTPRAMSESLCAMSQGFDPKLKPYRESEDQTQTNYWIQAFIQSANGKVYGVGSLRDGSYQRVEIYKQDDAYDSWETLSNSQASSVTPGNPQFLVEYKNYIWGASGAGTALWKYGDTSGSPTFTDAGHSLTFGAISNAIVHSRDDIMYFGYSNSSGVPYIARNNNGSWNDTVLQLPSGFVITSVCEYGNYLAIACRPKSYSGNSRVFLWDRDSSVTTLSESIDWGSGYLYHIEEVDGILVGVSSNYVSGFSITPTLSLKYYTGAVAKTYETLEATTTDDTQGRLTIGSVKQKADNALYFPLKIERKDEAFIGAFRVLKTSTGFSLSFAHKINNDTALDPDSDINSFLLVGDYMFYSFGAGAAMITTRTTDNATEYDSTSLLETLINQGQDEETAHRNKKLYFVGVKTEAMPDDGIITIEYGVDGGAYETIGTFTTNDGVYHEFGDISGTPFKDGHDYQFRFKSYGGAEIVSYSYQIEIINEQ